VVQTSLATEVSNLNDLDVDAEGWIVAGSRVGTVVLVDPQLATFRSWMVGSTPVFVAFVGS
jgi:hypothetical protein